MPVWISLALEFIVKLIKGLLGTDTLESHEVKHEKAHPATVDSDSKLIADLRRLHGSSDRAKREGHVSDSGAGESGEDRKKDGDKPTG